MIILFYLKNQYCLEYNCGVNACGNLEEVLNLLLIKWDGKNCSEFLL